MLMVKSRSVPFSGFVPELSSVLPDFAVPKAHRVKGGRRGCGARRGGAQPADWRASNTLTDAAQSETRRAGGCLPQIGAAGHPVSVRFFQFRKSAIAQKPRVARRSRIRFSE